MKKGLLRLGVRYLPVMLFMAYCLLLPSPVQAQFTQEWGGSCVASFTDDAGNAYDVATIQGLRCLIGNILSIGVSGVGLVGFVMFLIGSFRYLLSGGNSKETESARNTFTYVVVGLVVAVSAIIILRIIAAFTGVNSILLFEIPGSDRNWP